MHKGDRVRIHTMGNGPVAYHPPVTPRRLLRRRAIALPTRRLFAPLYAPLYSPLSSLLSPLSLLALRSEARVKVNAQHTCVLVGAASERAAAARRAPGTLHCY